MPDLWRSFYAERLHGFRRQRCATLLHVRLGQSPGLANLLSLSDDLNRYYQAEPPADVYEALKRRESDPKRLKKELQKDYDSISSNGPLAEFLKEQLKVALDGKNVEKLKKAKLLFKETKRGISTHPYSSEYQSDLDAEIPF